jgi:S1-C subfamily serine protease
MRSFINSFLAAVVGGLIVFAASNYTAPPEKREVPATGAAAEQAQEVSAKSNELTAEDIYNRYGNAVVHVKAMTRGRSDFFFRFPDSDGQSSTGSGFIVSDDGYVITNAHVVGDSTNIVVQFSDRAEVSAELVGIDQSTDLALLKIDPRNHNYQVLALGDSADLKVGETVYAIGNPLGYDRSMSQGIVSALNREIRAPNDFPIRGVIQTDAAINRGNSGGPLISSRGKVIGVTAQIASTGTGNIGIAFAIPSSTVKKVFTEIKETGKASHAWLGIQGTDLIPEVAKELKLDIERGAMVVTVLNPSPAKTAGLQGADRSIRLDQGTFDVGGDIITKLNKAKIGAMEDLIRELTRYGVGDEIELTVVRGKTAETIKITLEERPQQTLFPR